MIRVTLPQHLRELAQVGKEVVLVVPGDVTQNRLLGALEEAYPMLRLEQFATRRRGGGGRTSDSYFASGNDLSHEDPEAPLPAAVATGREPLQIIGAMAGG